MTYSTFSIENIRKIADSSFKRLVSLKDKDEQFNAFFGMVVDTAIVYCVRDDLTLNQTAYQIWETAACSADVPTFSDAFLKAWKEKVNSFNEQLKGLKKE